jgi:hypothetical protein
MLAALAQVAQGRAHPGSADPAGDFFLVSGEDERELAAKAVRLATERIPARLGLPPGEAVLVLAGGAWGPLGCRSLGDALRLSAGGRVTQGRGPGQGPGRGQGQGQNPSRQGPPGPPLSLAAREYRPGDRVLRDFSGFPGGHVGRALLPGDAGTLLSAGPGLLAVRVLANGRELACGPGELPGLLPGWVLPAAEAPPWASFPAVVLALGKGAERELDRAALYQAASLAEKLLVIVAVPWVYGKILANGPR